MMMPFTDEAGGRWVASAREEQTPRHHGRWFLVFHPEADEARVLSLPEVRWQTRATAERTLRTMSIFELRRRLHLARERALLEPGPSPADGTPAAAGRGATSVNAR